MMKKGTLRSRVQPVLTGSIGLIWILLIFSGCADLQIESQTSTEIEVATLVQGATIFDGSGAPRFEADVRLLGDQIVAVGRLEPKPGETVINATGLALAPGFIDTHSHADDDILQRLDARAAVSQGITTVVGGADGGSVFPLGDFFARLEETPPAVNLASFGGHNTYRDHILGKDFRRPATSEEIEKMRQMLQLDMASGALGLSTGLEYDPGIFSTTDEVVTLAREAASHGGRYTSHLRSEDRDFWAAVEELIQIGRDAQIPVNLTHIKLAMQSSIGQTERLLSLLDQAREEGIDVTADIYPYTYWQSTLEVLFPQRDFDDLESARFAVTEVSTPAGMLITGFAPDPELENRTLDSIAKIRGVEPAVALMDMIREAQTYRTESGEENVESVIATSMAEEDIDRLLQWPWINICTDGDLNGSHPRGFGSFPRILGHFVRDRNVLTLEEAIHKMTTRAAQNAGLPRRGRVEPEMFADLVLFDPARIRDRATTEDPHAASEGVIKVWVNGQLVWSDGKVTSARAGRVLRRSTTGS